MQLEADGRSGNYVLLDLHHIRAFCIVAEKLHITRAAQRLRVAQPALTRQIKTLERELNAPLLRRVGRRIELTAAGSLFHNDSVEMLKRLDGSVIRTQEAARGGLGQIKIGLCGSAGFFPDVVKVLARFRKDWPNVQITFIQERSAQLIDGLLNGSVDVAFVRPSMGRQAAIAIHATSTEPVGIGAPKLHRLASRKSIELKDLHDESMIAVSQIEHLAFQFQLEQACRRHGLTLRTEQEAPDLMTALQLVAAGMGCTFIPGYLVKACGHDLLFITVAEDPPLEDEISLVSRKEVLSVLAANFQKVAVTIMRPTFHRGS